MTTLSKSKSVVEIVAVTIQRKRITSTGGLCVLTVIIKSHQKSIASFKVQLYTQMPTTPFYSLPYTSHRDYLFAMSISTGTLNLKFMQRGTPLKASPSGPSTPTPSTPGTPVPASKGTSTSRTLVAEQDSEWQLPASKLKALQAGAGPSRPTQTRGRVSYESSYLPFLERGQPATTSSRKQLDSEEDGSVDDDEDKGVGSSKVIKGRMIFGQSAMPEQVRATPFSIGHDHTIITIT